MVEDILGPNHSLSNTCSWKAWTEQYKNFISWTNDSIIFAREDQFFPRFCLKIIRRFKYIWCSFSSMSGSDGLALTKCSKSFFTFDVGIPFNNLTQFVNYDYRGLISYKLYGKWFRKHLQRFLDFAANWMIDTRWSKILDKIDGRIFGSICSISQNRLENKVLGFIINLGTRRW